jgi:Cytosol aminopeptidase family, N-terminal domain
MKFTRNLSFFALILAAGLGTLARSDQAVEVKEKALDAPHKVKVKVRMEGPYTADVPLQVVCYFKYTPEGAKRMSGAPVELDKRLGGVIASLRERGEFTGNQLETILIIPPKDSIKAKALLLVGLGDEDALSLKLMEDVGRVSLREASRLGVGRVAFAPLIRDQGNSKLGTGEVETAVVRGMLLAYDTEKRLQKEGLSKEFTLEQWNCEAGPMYFDETVTGVEKAIKEAGQIIKNRSPDPLSKGK